MVVDVVGSKISAARRFNAETERSVKIKLESAVVRKKINNKEDNGTKINRKSDDGTHDDVVGYYNPNQGRNNETPVNVIEVLQEDREPCFVNPCFKSEMKIGFHIAIILDNVFEGIFADPEMLLNRNLVIVN
ncbi:hypothetical protein PHPALM_30604 [Phytophthora palmivora]|uniref:Uncharacterized protein n=1 Tax=Phytophthora palmivora TaxID=4796 RepID=A0A2P4X4Q8_9STRA|nr:hypothetical protein PHPALM_30604 [Phytophthora palmivora]